MAVQQAPESQQAANLVFTEARVRHKGSSSCFGPLQFVIICCKQITSAFLKGFQS